MSFEQRFALVLFSAFFLSSIATSLAAFIVASPLFRSHARPFAPGHAGALALCRLLPAMLAIALTAFVLGPGYFEHEQRTEAEGAGYALFALATGGLLVLMASLARVARAMARTSALKRAWLAEARPVDVPSAGMPAFALDLPFPLVAVLGVLRPRLFISRVVLSACSSAELRAILQHEHAHVMRRDNAVRMLMDASPDLLGFTRLPRAIADAWHQAVEHRADDAAAERLDLASALVKVARIATASPAIELPASALYRGEGSASIGTRVRRLVDTETEPRPRWMAAVAGSAVALGAIVFAVALTGAASRAAHAVLEATVSFLP
ncbi:MAG: M56 family metallopeptidase [Acidobacteriota bacterium]|nr:M56 family metallopeptidase [Acidobacteriota bacterium]